MQPKMVISDVLVLKLRLIFLSIFDGIFFSQEMEKTLVIGIPKQILALTDRCFQIMVV